MGDQPPPYQQAVASAPPAEGKSSGPPTHHGSLPSQPQPQQQQVPYQPQISQQQFQYTPVSAGTGQQQYPQYYPPPPGSYQGGQYPQPHTGPYVYPTQQQQGPYPAQQYPQAGYGYAQPTTVIHTQNARRDNGPGLSEGLLAGCCAAMACCCLMDALD